MDKYEAFGELKLVVSIKTNAITKDEAMTIVMDEISSNVIQLVNNDNTLLVNDHRLDVHD